MNKEGVILIAEDDEGHFELIKRSLQRAGVCNEILRFADGQETLDFLFVRGDGPKREHDKEYLLLLDIRMPKIDGIEVLEKVKEDPELKKIPVVMLTTTDDPRTIDRCHKLGCSIYVVKPVEYQDFAEAVRKVGLLLSVVEVPQINGMPKTKGVVK
ncbi:MAG: response regulator [Phycisphaerae bacterium]|nr:response regulator [Phycisphaerae bacterium]